MGRRRGFGGSSRSRGSGLFGRKPAPAKKPASRAPPPAKAPNSSVQKPAPAQAQSSGALGGIGSMIMQGMMFGTGSAIAHRAVDAVAGPRTVQHEWSDEKQPDLSDNDKLASHGSFADEPAAALPRRNPCEDQIQQFSQCVQQNNGDVGQCQFIFDLLSQCQRDAKDNSQWA